MFTYTHPMVPSEATASMRVLAVGMVAGALYRPVVDMVPSVALPPTTPLISHFTAVLVSPATTAVYCSVELTPRFVYPGLTVTVVAARAGAASGPSSAQSKGRILVNFTRMVLTTPGGMEIVLDGVGLRPAVVDRRVRFRFKLSWRKTASGGGNFAGTSLSGRREWIVTGDWERRMDLFF
jgi:hypothetical protein